MGNPRCNNPQSWVGPATGAVFFGLWTQVLSSQQSELLSEALSWLILPSLFVVARQGKEEKATPLLGSPRIHSEPPSWWSLWVIAICFSATSVFKAERGTIFAFVSTNTTTVLYIT